MWFSNEEGAQIVKLRRKEIELFLLFQARKLYKYYLWRFKQTVKG